MTRRNVFEDELPESNPLTGSAGAVPGLLSHLPPPERKKKRTRRWEGANRSKHYRGVPADLRTAIREIAETLSVPADEVARAFIEYAINCIDVGTLRLDGRINPRPHAQKMTLYPFNGAGWAVKGWNPQPPPAPSGRRKKSKSDPKAWQEIAHYRIPDELHERIKDIAYIHFPIGEVAAVLLKHGLEAYRAGTLQLTPQPSTAANVRWNSGR